MNHSAYSFSLRTTYLALALMTGAMTAEPTQAAGWKFWQTSSEETTSASGSGVGGMPYANSSKSAPAPSWSVTKAASGVWSGTTSMTKKAWNKTVDVVTLKPLRTSKPKPSQFRLGSHPDPRSQPKQKSGLFGSMFAPKAPSQPKTVDEFFSQERLR